MASRKMNPKSLENLKKGQKTQFSGERAAIEGRKGQAAAAENARMRKSLRDELDALLNQPVKDRKTQKEAGTAQMAISTALIQTAMKGGTAGVKAYEVIRDTIGEKPVDRVMVSEVDPTVIDEVEKMVTGHDEE